MAHGRPNSWFRRRACFEDDWRGTATIAALSPSATSTTWRRGPSLSRRRSAWRRLRSRKMKESTINVRAESARKPFVWQLTARDLMRAARIIHEAAVAAEVAYRADPAGSPLSAHENRGLEKVALSIGGLAVENLVKGALIYAHPELVQDDRLDKSLTTHKLADLFRRAGLRTTSDEANFLDRVQAHVEWAAKYPVPKVFADSLGQAEGIPTASYVMIPSDWELLVELYARAHGLELDLEYGQEIKTVYP